MVEVFCASASHGRRAKAPRSSEDDEKRGSMLIRGCSESGQGVSILLKQRRT